MIDAYTIKSYVRQAFRQTPNIDYVMRTVYRWIIDHLGPDPDWTGIDNMILMEFEKCRKEQEQRKMLLEMNAATARGIITDLETEDKIRKQYMCLPYCKISYNQLFNGGKFNRC
jgi:hypothetical protein